LPIRLPPFPERLAAGLTLPILWLLSGTTQLHAARDHSAPNPGFVTEFAASTEDVLQALQEVLQDQIIHGTQMFDREPTLTGAVVVESTSLCKPWKGEGKVFYKIRTDAIAPRHFQESADRGTIAVRYVLTSVSSERTRLRIDAIFVEAAHRNVHPSDGTVESSEYKAIQGHLQVIQFAEQEAAETQRRRESVDLAKQTFIREREDEASLLATAQSSEQDLEQSVKSLRREVERRVRAPGVSLKAAPFGSAANIANLPAYTEVVIVIETHHWYGVEIPSGLRGWLPLDQLELLPRRDQDTASESCIS
jgi:hypothetical protein